MTADEIRKHAEKTTPGSLEFFVAELAAQNAELNQTLRDSAINVNVTGGTAIDWHVMAVEALVRRQTRGRRW